MKVILLKVSQLVVTTLLPVAVDFLVSLLRKKIREYEKETPTNF